MNTSDAPLAEGPAGTLAYYAPWGDVAIYYGDCGGASGLYELGEAVSGSAYIADLTGKIEIEAVGASSVTPEPADSESSSAASQQAQSSATSQKPSSESQTVSQQTQSANSSQPPSSEAVASPSPAPSSRPAKDTSSEEDAVTKMNVQVDGLTFADTLADNAAVDSFVEMMQKAPVVINMRDYSGFEKQELLEPVFPQATVKLPRGPEILFYITAIKLSFSMALIPGAIRDWEKSTTCPAGKMLSAAEMLPLHFQWTKLCFEMEG